MRFGAHVSAAGGVHLAPARAAALGCEVFQFFSRPPQGGPAPQLTTDIVRQFKAAVRENKQAAAYIHTPYFINFASPNSRVRHGSIAVVRQELERGSLLGVASVMTHLGSAREVGEAAGVAATIEGLSAVLKGYEGETELLVELSAGAGATIGDTFEELAEIIAGVEKKLRKKNVLNICLDTQHAFASGYDLRTPHAISATLTAFKRTVGLARLRLVHCNDSKSEFASRVDRHANLGEGNLGEAAFRAIVQTATFRSLNFILETPRDSAGTEIRHELKLLKKFRGR